MMLRQLSIQLGVILAGAATASAGVLIVGNYSGTQMPAGRRVEFRIQDGRGKVTSAPGQVIYYDHAKRTSYMVDTQKGTSFEMNEERAKEVGARLAEAQRMMQEKLKEMPADKRAAIEEMMRKQGALPPSEAGAPRAPLKFAKAGSAKVGAWPCDRYAAEDAGRKVEVCAADASSLGIAAEDMAVFEGFLSFSEKMASDTAAGGGIGIAGDRGFPGMPLDRAESRGGKVTDRFTIESIKPETVAATEMQVPAGLKPVVPPGQPGAR